MQKLSKKIFYVSELNLPNSSAQSIHVTKMCEAISKIGYDINLFCFNISKNNIFSFYNIKFKFRTLGIFKNSKKFTLLNKFFFSFKILFINKNINHLFYISRSIIFALIASTMGKKVILELHHEITGFSKLAYYFLKFFGFLKNLNYIFINKNLNKIYNINKKKFIVLDDAVCIENFEKNFKEKKLRNTCVYIGSFFKGKGLEKIIEIAKLCKKINFHLYGDKSFLNKKNNLKNVKIFNHIPYSKIPKILSKYNIALMPYEEIVQGRGNINIQNYMSPMKMFDYLAGQLIILSSDIAVLKHVLTDKYNSILIKKNNIQMWSKEIIKIFQNPSKYKYIKYNAYLTAQKYTWDKRAEKLFKKFI